MTVVSFDVYQHLFSHIHSDDNKILNRSILKSFPQLYIVLIIKMGYSNFEHTPQTKFPHGTTASQKATVRAFDKFYRYANRPLKN